MDFTVVDSHGKEYMDGNITAESISSLGVKDEFVDLLSRLDGRATTKIIPVKVRKLDTLLATHAPDVKNINVVCVDVEGWELSVMRGLSLERFRPEVVILENLMKKQEYRDFMGGHGYTRWLDLGHNEVYVRADQATMRVRLLGSLARTQYISLALLGRVRRKLSGR